MTNPYLKREQKPRSVFTSVYVAYLLLGAPTEPFCYSAAD